MERSAYNMLLFVGVIGMLLMLLKEGSAEQHVVGGKQGWDESTDFDSWASSETFKVGDTLVFKYSPMHSVVELGNEDEYKKCGVTSATHSMSDGNSVIKLTKVGTRYFACGTAGHCDQGMKVKITTVSASSPGSSASTPTSTSSSTSSNTCVSGFVLSTAILVLSALMMMNILC